MGFNISGIAIDKNWQHNFEELQKVFGWELLEQEEIDFETASANWKDDHLCDVYFTAKGTLLFIPMDMCIEAWTVPTANSFTFALSETSTAFNFNYAEGETVTRSVMEVNDELMTDEGTPLPAETNSEDTSEMILHQIGIMIGKSFQDIDLGEKAIRYTFGTPKEAVPELQVEVSSKEPTPESFPKKWWRFWK